MYLSIREPHLMAYALGALGLGFIMTQAGMYLSSRWGRSPRPDERLDAALKGLPGEATIYHWNTPAPHLLVGPMGVWVLLPYPQHGKLIYDKNRWRLSGGGFMQTYMSIFGQDGLGRPDIDAEREIVAVRKFLAKKLGAEAAPAVRAALVFTSDRLQIDASDAPMPALLIKKLKDFMRQQSKESALPASILDRVRACLPEA